MEDGSRQRMFELSEVRVNESFYKEVHRGSAIVRDNKSLSYPVSELLGVNCLNTFK